MPVIETSNFPFFRIRVITGTFETVALRRKPGSDNIIEIDGSLMKNDGQKFLEQLASSTSDSFEGRFSFNSSRLGLGASFSRNELTLLFQAALLARRCNDVFNGLDDGRLAFHVDLEARRNGLEFAFMEARDILYASPGWQALSPAEQSSIERVFLAVSIAEDRLAS
jgi:hypothetical protein